MVARSVSPPPDLEDVVERVQSHRAELEALGVRYLGVFGSVARGDARPDSDVDMLVEVEGTGGVVLQDFLVEILGRDVDAVPRDYVRPRIKSRVEGEAIEVFPDFKGRHQMPPKQPREWRMYIEDMIQAGERMIEKTAGLSPMELMSDKDRLESVAWNCQVIGEAIRNLPEDFRKAHPEIPWAQMRAFRNQVVHGYWQIDPARVITIARDFLPGDLELLRNLLTEDGS